jgi:thiol reductant ABC exporter CydC subunit
MSRATDPIVAPEATGPSAPVRATVELARSAAPRLALATLLGAGAVGAGIGLIATSAWLISRASQRPPESALALAIVGVQFFGLSRALFRYGGRLAGHDAAFRALADLRMNTYRRLEELAPAGLPAFRSGDLLARIVHDVDSLQDLLLRVIPPFAIALIVGVVIVSLVWWILPAAGLILLAALVLAATVVPWLTGRLAKRSESQQAAARGELTATVVDLLQGAPELVAYGALEAQLQKASAHEGRLARIATAGARTAGIGQGLTTLLPGVAMWTALLVGIGAVTRGALDGVVLAVVALVPLASFEMVSELPAATQTMQRVRRSAARVFDILATEPPVVEPEHPLPVPSAAPTLEVRGLRASYGEHGPRVLDGVDLELRPGQTMAVVGRSGAGKSTLANVLLRFLPYRAGLVTLDGVPLHRMSGDEIRRVVGLVSQDAHVFDSTLEENLRLARRDATEDELRHALSRARLLEWTDSLPGGLATRVGPNGAHISGGQRQRLAVARALLADFPVLIVDEPGEHLDTVTADALVEDLLASTPDRAVLLITHRLAGLEQADEVIVLQSGRVAERGTHAQLLASDGQYADMWMRERNHPF